MFGQAMSCCGMFVDGTPCRKSSKPCYLLLHDIVDLRFLSPQSELQKMLSRSGVVPLELGLARGHYHLVTRPVLGWATA